MTLYRCVECRWPWPLPAEPPDDAEVCVECGSDLEAE